MAPKQLLDRHHTTSMSGRDAILTPRCGQIARMGPNPT
jgi:hypothetical protein